MAGDGAKIEWVLKARGGEGEGRGLTRVHALVEPALFIRRQSIGPPLGIREPKVRGGRHRENKGAFEHHCRVITTPSAGVYG